MDISVMIPISYSIAPEVFAQFPGYVRGVVLAHDVTNRPSPPELVDLLRTVESTVRSLLTLEMLTEKPQLSAWREAFRTSGVKPSEFRPSVEALLRRVLRPQDLPSINALVDIGNLISLGCLVPIGGHAIDGLMQDIALRPATGAEEFVPFGSDQMEHPVPGEIIFVEGNIVLTRRWIWRQANHTITLPTTTAIEFNVDGLPPTTPEDVVTVCEGIIDLVGRFCGGRLRYETLSQEHPCMQLQ